MLRKVAALVMVGLVWSSGALLAQGKDQGEGKPEGKPDGKRTESVKIGTLAPGESPWGQVFKTWQRALKERTKLPDGQKTPEGKDYALELNFFWNGQQGDEAAMVTKIKSGQLEARPSRPLGSGRSIRRFSSCSFPGSSRPGRSSTRLAKRSAATSSRASTRRGSWR